MKIKVDWQVNVFADLDQLKTVLYNLLNNSYEAIMREKNFTKELNYCGEIEIKMYEKSSQAYIHIRDNGYGLDKTLLDQLFAFLFTSKGHGQKKELREEEGTGRGMRKIQAIIKAHEGDIQAISKGFHQGCEFIIILPLSPSNTTHQ